MKKRRYKKSSKVFWTIEKVPYEDLEFIHRLHKHNCKKYGRRINFSTFMENKIRSWVNSGRSTKKLAFVDFSDGPYTKIGLPNFPRELKNQFVGIAKANDMMVAELLVSVMNS